MLRLIALASLAIPVVAPQQQERSAEQFVAALQTRYDSIRDFSADFVHSYEGGVVRRHVVESGSVLVKKPGKMRWTYTTPEEKLFVTDGVKIYSYIPADKQVIVSSMPAQDQATAPMRFLIGSGNLTRDFSATTVEAPEAPPGSVALKLVPRLREREYDWLIVVVDRVSFRLHSLTSADQQDGRSTIVFTNLKENLGLADKSFTFKIPRGVDVVTSDSND